MKKLIAGFAFLSALAVAGAGSNYRVDLYQDTVVNGATFKRGECKVEVKDNQIVFKQGKVTAEASAKVESAKDKFLVTTVGYTDGNHIQEIRLGGTTTKLVFGNESTGATGGK